ncbi:CAP domain-containing protein [Streptomyces sp. NBC_01136]|uniref:CAP domain-containing protein n=1 Tax=unclassified Streptomyces TaxID=2593676 RepID=UPI00324A82F5|nr:CAP domain-containing protein [Streptomyces sp. NBC_01136]
MGRHRRSAAGRAATGRATGVTDTNGPLTESYGPENLYGYAAVADLPQTAAARSHRKRKTADTVRTGLLGVSAAVALGTVAVASGVLPGTENYSLGGASNSSDNVQAVGSPSSQETQQGGTSGSASTDNRDGTSTSRDADRSASPSASASAAPATSSAAPATTPTQEPTTTQPGKATKTKKPATPPGQVGKTKGPKTTAPITVSAEAAAEAEVLKLVNEERAKVGCSPVAANSALSDLAQAFSEDMAARDFFDHTDPSGLSPWDRAAKAGITSLGGENIARGQADATAVMDAWMNSAGHRANILNCDFKTLGVGVHFGVGGPWWTQDFGY